MDTIVTIKLSFRDAQLVVESLKELQMNLHEHGAMKGGDKTGEAIHGRQKSREKALRLSNIIKLIEG